MKNFTFSKLNPRFVSNFDIRQLLPGLYGQTLDMSGLPALVLPSAITAAGASALDLSGSTGTFKTPTGAVTIGSGAVGISGAVTYSSTQVGMKPVLVSGSGATATLTAAQSGSVVLFDRAAGIVFTLPAPAVGLYFDFIVTTSITSNSAKVITDAGTTLLIGQVSNAVAAGTATDFIANGTTHIAITQNGTTSGGLIGTQFKMTCVSATQWNVRGTILGSGTIVTPFATS